jgi:hypothetical protein
MNYTIPENHDISLLRPASLRRGQRFETKKDVQKTAINYIIPGLKTTMPREAEKITDCVEGDNHCLLPICPACARRYRRFITSELLRIYELKPNEAQTATIYLDTYPAGKLQDASIPTAHGSFQKRLQRCGFNKAVLVGGTEVTYRQETDDWLLHLHLLALNVPEEAQTKLDNVMRKKKKSHDPLRFEPVTEDYIDQLSYLQKFHTYHRPGVTHGKSRAKPYPLGKKQMRELASWTCSYSFSDFTFCFGVRRHHGRIVCDVAR